MTDEFTMRCMLVVVSSGSGSILFTLIIKVIQAFVIRLTMALAYFLYIACSTLGTVYLS